MEYVSVVPAGMSASATNLSHATTSFAAGASLGSFLFFFALGYGAGWLRPVFARPAAWRLLDLGIALVMTGIAAQRARTVILDITGVHDVDSHAAEALVRAAEGARLHGAAAILSGITPALARTLVALGVPLHRLVHVEFRKIIDTRAGMGMCIVVAAVTGLTLVGAVAWSHRLGLEIAGGGLPVMLGVVVGVSVLVALLTLPAATTRLTPELLREE